MATFINIITRVEVELSLMGGVDVQTYAQPKLASKLQRAFNDAFDTRFWKDYRKSIDVVINTATGVSTTDLTAQILRFADIEYIWLPNVSDPLPEAPNSVNPSLIQRPCFVPYNSAPAGRFKILPVGTISSATISYRTKPADFVDSDEVPFNEDWLVAAVCADYLVDEGANLKSAEKYMKAAETQMKDLVKLETKNDKALGTYVNAPGINSWW